MIDNWFLFSITKNGFFFQEHDDDYRCRWSVFNKKDVIVLVSLL